MSFASIAQANAALKNAEDVDEFVSVAKNAGCPAGRKIFCVDGDVSKYRLGQFRDSLLIKFDSSTTNVQKIVNDFMGSSSPELAEAFNKSAKRARREIVQYLKD